MTASSARSAGQNGTGHQAKPGKGLALVSTVIIVLVAGIALGNAPRKRVDMWIHGYK